MSVRKNLLMIGAVVIVGTTMTGCGNGDTKGRATPAPAQENKPSVVESVPELKNVEPPEVSGTRPVYWLAGVLDISSDSCTIVPLDSIAADMVEKEKQDKANKEAEYWARATNNDTGEVTKWFNGKGSVTITGLDWGRMYYLETIRVGDDDYANSECMNAFFYVMTKDND